MIVFEAQRCFVGQLRFARLMGARAKGFAQGEMARARTS
jgi:hypothetical protein